jgi:hypothetical protein
MTRTLQALLKNLFDYAGLYPPTNLPLEPAFDNYLRYRKGAEALATNRFVCPAAKLPHLAELIRKSDAQSLGVSVTSSADPFNEESLETDFQAITGFDSDMGSQATVYGYELKLHPDSDLKNQIQFFSGDAGIDEFLEIPWQTEVAEAVGCVAESAGPYAKARCGGAYVPTPDELAKFLKACFSLDVPFKLTAGLHHPLAADGQHGFFNVLVASALIEAEDIPTSTAAVILGTRSFDDFVLADDQIGWKDLSAPLAAIEDARKLFLNIGSCSIEEPLSDLDAAGLIPSGSP